MIEVISLIPVDGAGTRAIATVRVDGVEIRQIRVIERGGNFQVRLPRTVTHDKQWRPVVSLEKERFMELREALMWEFGRVG